MREKTMEEFESLAKSAGLIDTSYLAKRLYKIGYFSAPASISHHGNHQDGLYVHSKQVYTSLQKLTSKNGIIWGREESSFIIGMFHDLCKCDDYTPTDSGEFIRNPKTSIHGHGDKSVMLLSTLMQLTEEEVMCIRYHMGAFTKEEDWEYYTRAIHVFPNVLWTHHADMLAAHVYFR